MKKIIRVLSVTLICIILATVALFLSLVFKPTAVAYEAPVQKVGIVRQGIVSAYNSEVGQTDDTPFITASGQHVRDGIVANNCLPFGTDVVIDGKLYEVQDRMNSRYSCEYFDIWMESKPEALRWGRKNIEVVEVID